LQCLDISDFWYKKNNHIKPVLIRQFKSDQTKLNNDLIYKLNVQHV